LTQKAGNGAKLYPDGAIEIPGKGNLPPILIAVTASEANDPALVSFGRLTWNSLDAGLSFANLPAWLYVGTSRIQRLLMIRFPERLLLNRMCTNIQRLLVQTYKLSFQLTHGKVTGKGEQKLMHLLSEDQFEGVLTLLRRYFVVLANPALANIPIGSEMRHPLFSEFLQSLGQSHLAQLARLNEKPEHTRTLIWKPLIPQHSEAAPQSSETSDPLSSL
jgi:hypothetical protein